MKSVQFGVLAIVIVAAGFFGIRYFYPDLLNTTQSDGAATAESKPAAGGGGRGGSGRGGGGRPPALVVPAAVKTALINDRLKAVGNGIAQASVSVVPLSNGLLTDIRVSAGQNVDAGDILATMDDAEQLIARDRAARSLDVARTDVRRLEQLFRTRTSTEAELDKAKAILIDAELALREAELTLSRRAITAPISGIVGFVAVDKGNYVTTQDELMTIDDRSTIVVEFWVPERFASQMQMGQTLEATALSAPAIRHTGTVIGIGSRIETDSRTLPVKASIDNAEDTLRPGMSFELAIAFSGESFPAVNPLAIQWDSSGSFVWKLTDDGKVKREAVRIIQRNPESVLVEAPLNDADQVVIEGLMALRNGASVRIQGAAPAQSGQAGKNSQRNRQDGEKNESGKPDKDSQQKTMPDKDEGEKKNAPNQAERAGSRPAENTGS